MTCLIRLCADVSAQPDVDACALELSRPSVVRADATWTAASVASAVAHAPARIALLLIESPLVDPHSRTAAGSLAVAPIHMGGKAVSRRLRNGCSACVRG